MEKYQNMKKLKMVKLMVSKITNNTSMLFIILLNFEFLYSSYTGQFSILTLPIAIVFAFFVMLIKNPKFNLLDLFGLIVSLYFVLYSYNLYNLESLRYGLTILMIVFWNKINLPKIEKVIQIMIYTGSILSIIQFFSGPTRIYGFYATSAAQYACTLLILQFYLLVISNNEGFSKLRISSIALCVIQIVFTGARSILIFSLGLLLLYVYIINFRNKIGSNSKTIFIIAMSFFFLFFLMVLFGNFDYLLLNSFGRTSVESLNSINTRENLLFAVLGQLDSIKSYVFGHGGGYVEEFLKYYLVSNTYYPAHQDYAVLLVEYGIIGYFLLYFGLFKKHFAKLYFFILFTVSSLHNGLLNPSLILLMFITMKNIEDLNYKLWY